MRGAELGLDRATAERIAGTRPAAPRDELRKSGKLESQPGGRAIVHDRVTTMTVDADGGITFEDKKDIDLRIKAPLPIWDEQLRKEVKDHIAKWLEDPFEGTRYGRSQDLPRHLQAAPGACEQWGAAMCEDPLAPGLEKRWRELKRKLGGELGGNADITAWLHRKLVGDPYASRKLKLLADTLDERVAMGATHRAQQQLRSAEYMRRNLERLWASELDPAARKEALFELWDECGDDEAGSRARAIVIGWIRTHLPNGSPDAFTDGELAALQARRLSATAFEPYAP